MTIPAAALPRARLYVVAPPTQTDWVERIAGAEVGMLQPRDIVTHT